MGANIIESVMEFELIIISKMNKYVLNYFVEEKESEIIDIIAPLKFCLLQIS